MGTVIGTPKLYRASRRWESNVHASIVAGFGGGALMITIAALVLWSAKEPIYGVLLLAFFFLNAILAWFLLYPCNLVCKFPYAIEVRPGAGLLLFAPWKHVYIPLESIQGIRRSVLQGYVIRVQRQGVLKAVVIHHFFGPAKEPLVQAVSEAIHRSDRSSII
jgi:hypothetical protein